jgi:hypothetical protein
MAEIATGSERSTAQGPAACPWLQARRHPGRVWFEVDVPAGEPSKWLTLSGMRVLDWWDASRSAVAVTP